jgi:hypothetical protein
MMIPFYLKKSFLMTRFRIKNIKNLSFNQFFSHLKSVFASMGEQNR